MELRSGLVLTSVVIGIAFMLAGALMSYRAFVESRYIPAIGRALTSEVRIETTGMSGSSTRTKSWKLFVEYEYWLGGEHFISDRVASSRPSSSASSGQGPSQELLELGRRYGPGREIIVYVSPSADGRAILLQISYFGLWFVFIGIGLISVGAFAAFRAT